MTPKRMKTEILIRNLQNKARFNVKYIKKVIEKTIQYAGAGFSPVEVSFTVVDNRRIKYINKKYRKVNRVTDVISFPSAPEFGASPTAWQSGIPGKSADFDFNSNKVYGGDIFVSIEKARSQARKFNHSIKKELTLLCAHGVLHLFGYDHARKKDAVKMRKKEEEVLNCPNL